MKVSKDYLRKLIKEELELDEGLGSREQQLLFLLRDNTKKTMMQVMTGLDGDAKRAVGEAYLSIIGEIDGALRRVDSE